MRVLCPLCGFYHPVIRVLEEGESGMRREVYQVAEVGLCPDAYLSEQGLFEATAKFGLEALLEDEDDSHGSDDDYDYEE